MWNEKNIAMKRRRKPKAKSRTRDIRAIVLVVYECMSSKENPCRRKEEDCDGHTG